MINFKGRMPPLSDESGDFRAASKQRDHRNPVKEIWFDLFSF